MSSQKKIVVLVAALAVGSGLVGLGAHSSGRETGDASAARTDASFLSDLNLSEPADAGLGNRALFVKMMLSVALVGVLAVAAFYVSRKVLPKVTHAPGKEIRVLETAYLGPRKTLHLVQVGNQRLLVGSTTETIATLAHIDNAWFDLSKQEVDGAMNL